jgi:hypothetical protein
MKAPVRPSSANPEPRQQGYQEEGRFSIALGRRNQPAAAGPFVPRIDRGDEAPAGPTPCDGTTGCQRAAPPARAPRG